MPPALPRRRADLVVERAGPEVLVYSAHPPSGSDASGGAIHALNPTAALIWDLCDGAHGLPEIEQAIRAAFSLPAGYDLGADIRANLARFDELGLLEK